MECMPIIQAGVSLLGLPQTRKVGHKEEWYSHCLI